MFGKQLYTDASISHIGEDPENLTVVCHLIKKGR